jgi:molecular chaperone DnaJ
VATTYLVPGILDASPKLTMGHLSFGEGGVRSVAVQADWLERDLYAVLGLPEDADSKTISRAYRQLARELHPDTHPDDPDATERFKGVTAAYDVLSDETKRAEYDEFRRAAGPGPSGRNGGAWASTEGRDFVADDDQPWTTFDGSTWTNFDGDSLDDLLSRLVGRTGHGPATRWPGDDLEAVLDLSFVDAVHGLTTEVTLNGPDGSQSFKVRVPPGVHDGQRIRLSGKGGPGVNGGPPGDLYAVVRVAAHHVFGRRGLDLMVEAPIGWPEAVLGTEVEVPTLDGPPVRVRVPAGTPHGRTLRVRGRGVRTDKGTGDLLVRIGVTVPGHITADQRQAVQAVAEAFSAA